MLLVKGLTFLNVAVQLAGALFLSSRGWPLFHKGLTGEEEGAVWRLVVEDAAHQVGLIGLQEDGAVVAVHR